MFPSTTSPNRNPRHRTAGTLARMSIVALAALGVSLTSSAAQVAVTFTNTGPQNGIWFVSPWVAFHDGGFDAFGAGLAASAELEALAEDGNSEPIDGVFIAANPDGVSGTLGGPTAPGWSRTYVFDLDPMNPDHRYMSYLFMIIPSNDAWAGNDDPTTVEIFDESGNFVASSFTIPGSSVLDAGTEVNDEVPANTAFLEQAAPNTGTDEGGVIATHPGFMTAGSGGVLDATTDFGGTTSEFSAGDFTAPDYNVARVTVSMVNNPPTASKLVAISTRAFAGAGDNTQIAGISVSPGDDKRVLIRGIGPGLAEFGVEGVLEDPTISVFDANGMLIASNDDWETQEGGASALTELTEAIVSTSAFGLATGSADAALVVTLSPGTYTAHIVPKAEATGVALIETYEVED